MAKGNFFQYIPIQFKGPVEIEVDFLVRKLLIRAMTEVGLPAAQAKAPENIKNQISITPVSRGPTGEYKIGLSIPGQYRYVELGTGPAAGHESWSIENKYMEMPWGWRRAMHFNPGQEGKHFLDEGIAQAEGAFFKWLPNSIFKLLQSGY